MSDTLNRTIYGRLFKGSFQDIADTVPSQLIGALFDKTYMPSLLLDPGKQVYYDFKLNQSDSAVLALPENYTAGAKLYIAVQVDLLATLAYTSPTHGAGNIVLLKGTNTTSFGTHRAFWTYQGDMTTFQVSIPTSGAGGLTTSVQVFMYEIPDLANFESYFDKQIGLGTSGA